MRSTDKPYHIKAHDRLWWYKAEAVRLADGGGDAPAAGGDVSSAVVGSLVVLAPDYASYSDAGGGPLSLGQVGVVVQTSGTRLQVKPQSGGDRVWWYVGHGGDHDLGILCVVCMGV